jgi:GNAT superfamily N-acetyltransferase
MHPDSLYIDLIEQNLLAFYSAWAKAMNIPVVVHEGMSLVFQQNMPWPSFGLFPSVPGGQEAGFVRTTARKISEGAFPPYLICTDREQNRDLMHQLETAGFRPVTIWSGMARDLHEPVHVDEIDNFQIQKVTEFSLASEFSRLINREIFRASWLDAKYFQSSELISFHAFTGSVAGEVCSTSSIFCQDKAAGLYFISTLPALRRKGFGKRMTLMAMQEAEMLGCDTLILHATRAGKGLYEQLGFMEYCRLIIYWLPG